MPRLTPSQLGLGTLAVVAPTVALLALSGAQSVLAITMLVVVCLAIGTLAAMRRRRPVTGSRVVAQGSPPAVESIPATGPLASVPERERVHH
jgi:hypothetical protein